MASKYWIKLYHEVLHDPKMGLMPDNLWRRTIELFLLAGEVENEGHLPSTSEIAWTLRLDDQKLEKELQELEKAGILQREGDSWLVIKFAKRQEAVPADERMRRMRERQKRDVGRVETAPKKRNKKNKKVVTRNVTKRNTDTDIDTDKNTTKVGTPLAVKEYRKQAHRYPPKSWYEEIAKVVGEEDKNVTFWGQVVHAWVGRGYNPINVKGQLDCYRKHEIPGERKNGSKSTAPEDRTTDPTDPDQWAAMLKA